MNSKKLFYKDMQTLKSFFDRAVYSQGKLYPIEAHGTGQIRVSCDQRACLQDPSAQSVVLAHKVMMLLAGLQH